MNDIIKIKNVSYSYDTENGENIAISDVSLNIGEGEFVAFIGHNGSGKSTLVKMLNALIIPDEGQITVDGMLTSEAENKYDIRRKVGMVFQNPDNQLIATLVEDDVAFGPENLGIPPKEIVERVDSALKAVDMTEFRNKAPHLLSGGQKQRVAIAGVLAIRPDIIVLDEPTAMLDPEGRNEVLSTVLRLNKEEKKTIVFVTHFMEEVVYASRAVVLYNGKIVFNGTPRELFENEQLIKEVGMTMPIPTALYHRLKAKGIDIKDCPLMAEEIVEEICRLL